MIRYNVTINMILNALYQWMICFFSKVSQWWYMPFFHLDLLDKAAIRGSCFACLYMIDVISWKACGLWTHLKCSFYIVNRYFMHEKKLLVMLNFNTSVFLIMGFTGFQKNTPFSIFLPVSIIAIKPIPISKSMDQLIKDFIAVESLFFLCICQPCDERQQP